MAQIKTIDLARQEMFTPREELEKRFSPERVEHLIRLRDMYNFFLNDPAGRDRNFVDKFRAKYNISQSMAYADLALVKQLLPALAPASREFHRKQVSEMLLETYNMAKARKDVKAMALAAKELGKVNRVDLDDEKELPYELIVVQPFSPSLDPTLIGLKRIDNLEEVKARLRKQLAADNPDIEDIDYELADLEEESLFPDTEDETSISE
ncbi:MAG: hypothetical protein E7075_00670 [Bacteroidales bacterium]|nr:hypothetical protein [Bacteroidales bacterium]MEE0922663.1 hypothetical protein [Paludibacteraceae bacterium]